MKFTEQDIRNMVSEAIGHIRENMQSELQAWHGSINLFDKFDTKFIGTGESTQVYGWGLYMTGVRETANYYAALIANKKNADDKSNAWLSASVKINNIFKPLFKQIRRGEISFDEFKATAMEMFKKRKLPQEIISIFASVQNMADCRKFDYYIRVTASKQYKKYVYMVELPDSGFIDWNSTDKNLIYDIYSKFAQVFDVSHVNIRNINTFGELYSALCGGKSLYRLRKSVPKIEPKAVSQFLNKLGFVGISVPIGNRNDGDNTGSNYVIFNSDDVKIKKVDSV